MKAFFTEITWPKAFFLAVCSASAAVAISSASCSLFN